MGLSESQKAKLTNHLHNNVQGCPICGSKSLSLGDVTFQGLLDPEYKQPVEGSIYPLVTVMCDNCYHVFQFAAKPMGLI